MAEDTLKASSRGPTPAPASIPALDGAADARPTNQAPPSSLQSPRPPPPAAHDADGDTQMTSPTRPTNPTTTQGAPPTPDASPRAPFAAVQTGPVPLDSPLRTTPIHPSLPSVKVPDSTPNLHPVTLQPFTDADLSKHGYEKLRAQIFAPSTSPTTAAAAAAAVTDPETLTAAQKAEIARLRDETAAVLKQKLDEREARVREIEREMEEKEKIREVERKVFRKKLAGGGREG